MAVSITTIQGTDNVAMSRLTINANFSALKAVSDALTALLDPTTYSLSGIKSVSIDNSAVALSSTILSVSKSATILGSLNLGSVAQPTSLTINGTGAVSILSSSVTLGSGNFTMSSANSVLTQNGSLLLGGQFRSTGLNTSYSNIVTLITPVTNVNVTGSYNNKYLFLTNGSTASYAPDGLTATLSEGTEGQVLEIFHVKGPVGPTVITTTNFWGLEADSTITMTETGDKITCIYENGAWFLWEVEPVYTGASGTGSIVYTRDM